MKTIDVADSKRKTCVPLANDAFADSRTASFGKLFEVQGRRAVSK